jgi:predicted nucleotidyltransferase
LAEGKIPGMDLLDRLRERAASLPEVKLAVLFGSTARGQARKDSDVDLGLLLDPDTRAVRVHGRAARRDVHIVHLSEAPPLLRFEISRDGVVIREQEEGLWTGFKARAMVDWWIGRRMPSGSKRPRSGGCGRSGRWQT